MLLRYKMQQRDCSCESNVHGLIYNQHAFVILTC